MLTCCPVAARSPLPVIYVASCLGVSRQLPHTTRGRALAEADAAHDTMAAAAAGAGAAGGTGSMVTVINGVSIYSLSSGKILPSWMPEAKRKALKKHADYARRIDLLQDFGFPVAAQTVAFAPDGRHVMATGTYPPRVRMYDTAELSMKFERYMDATPVAAAFLGDDYSKLAFLQDDRNVEVHAAYGKHYRTRIPKFGRHMLYHAPTAEVLIAASDAEVYRLNLEAGRFMAPLALPASAPAANKLAVSRVTAVIAAGCEGGTVEIFDPRSHARAASVSVPGPGPSTACDVTAVSFDDSGLALAAGTSDGRALLYDIRRATPLQVKQHQYGLPILDVRFHRGSGGTGGSRRGGGTGSESGGAGGNGGAGATGSTSCDLMMSTDAKSIKLWRRADGATWTNIEATATIRDVAIASDAPTTVGGTDSGLILAAGDTERIMAYYLPQLGLAPRWCSFLDSLTEELEEGAAASEGAAGGAAAVYDDYRFVTRDELAALGLSHLIGTPLLKAVMHGFFMDAKLYARVQAVVDPFAYDRWRRTKVKAAVDEARASRIVMEEKLPKVNKDLARRLLADQQRAAAEAAAAAQAPEKAATARGSARKRAASTAPAAGDSADGGAAAASKPSLLSDSRFAKLFSDPQFAIDTDSAEYLQLHPQTAASGRGNVSSGGGGGGARAAKRRRGGQADDDSDVDDDS